jgi:glyoxylase-like metal-dependent hydrolase (beta-lactamase superfamily II)
LSSWLLHCRLLDERRLRLKGVLLTHLHADFVSGHEELRRRLGVTIFVGAGAEMQVPHYPVHDGEQLVLSSRYAMAAMTTPGHTTGCVTWLLVDRRDGNKPLKAFTGDTLFVGSVGRPDLLGSVGVTPEDMARMMFDSLHNKLMKLPDDVEVHPAHGPGAVSLVSTAFRPCLTTILCCYCGCLTVAVMVLWGSLRLTVWQGHLTGVYRHQLACFPRCSPLLSCALH